jgi:hypothetical protein
MAKFVSSPNPPDLDKLRRLVALLPFHPSSSKGCVIHITVPGEKAETPLNFSLPQHSNLDILTDGFMKLHICPKAQRPEQYQDRLVSAH